jgi:hypothetical protein
MIKRPHDAYVYTARCPLSQPVEIRLTLPDFGDPPSITHCVGREALYWHTPEDEAYIQPIKERLRKLRCVVCNRCLEDTLVSSYKRIYCPIDKSRFDLDDNFAAELVDDDLPFRRFDFFELYS